MVTKKERTVAVRDFISRLRLYDHPKVKVTRLMQEVVQDEIIPESIQIRQKKKKFVCH